MLDRGIGTLAYNSSWNLFDQIIVSGTLLKDNTGESQLHFFQPMVHNFEFLKDKEGNRVGYPAAHSRPVCSSTATPTTSPRKSCCAAQWRPANAEILL